MNKTMKLIAVIGILLLALAGCTSKNEDVFVPVEDLTVSPDFDWKTTQKVNVDLELMTNVSEPIPNTVFEIFFQKPDANSIPVGKAATNSEGRLLTSITAPTNVHSIWARGFMSTIEMPIVNGVASTRIGGEMFYSTAGDFQVPDDKAWKYLPGVQYDPNTGAPNPQYVTNTPLSADFLARVNNSLPEGTPLPQTHPEYLVPTNQLNLRITEEADVTITFVHEGAGYLNALGFIVYNSNNVPQTTNQANRLDHTIIFPNASLPGSGGNLPAGTTLELGRFQAGQTISWFLVADGFNKKKNPMVDTSKPRYYSLSHLNPEKRTDNKQHSVQFYDPATERFIIAFEDVNREDKTCDQDFNDLIFFFSANPVEAVGDIENIPGVDDPEPDSDGDGIIDAEDDYPDDEELAFNNYTYGPNGWGTLAFEDLWPNVGDYDFNDMVIDYNFNQITNAENKVKKVEMKFKLRAMGASFNNGFAIETPFNSADIYAINASHPELFEKEEGSRAVLRFFEGGFSLMPKPGGYYVNTQPEAPFVEPVAFSVSFMLETPVLLADLEMAPYNPFIFVNKVRSKEIHLPGFAPTALMDHSHFGTGDDASSEGNWYKSGSCNLPWAINIPVSWDYPVEHAQVSKPHLKFKDWVQSDGNSYQDWYLNKSGYRNSEFIYQTP